MGFNPRLAPYSLCWVFDADPAADEVFTLFEFPVEGKFLNAKATNTAAIATATNTLALYVVKASTAAANSVQGTLASFAAGSTWAVDTTRDATITAFGSTALFAAGEKILLSYDETTTGTWTELGFQVDYVLGYDTGETPAAASEPSED